MAYVLVALGLMLTIAGVRDKQGDLFELIQGDFTGPNSFIYWLFAVAIIGGIGYVPGFKDFSRAFLGLLLLVFILNQGTGLFDRLKAGLTETTAPAQPEPESILEKTGLNTFTDDPLKTASTIAQIAAVA